MSAPSQLLVNEDHPLALELTSLRAAVSRYQHEAHSSSVKLQRHSLDTSHALEQSHSLERENALLKEEVAILRAHSDTTPHPSSHQIPELTLALRKLSDKLTLTEETLLTRTNELVQARHALTQAKLDADAARELTAQALSREEQCRAGERELVKKARAAEEERKMADLVVQEYADLVRSLEGRSKTASQPPGPVQREASSSSVTLVEGLAEGKTGLQKLLEEFNRESERLATEISRLQGDIESLTATLETERKTADDVRAQLASTIVQLDKHNTDDNTAAKMVSRYMKFSQSTTDSLQKAMENLRTRHAATAASLNTQIDHLQKALLAEHRQAETLRNALDELSEDISREAYGRRREISLRLAFLGREEGLAENLRRWIRRSKESFTRTVSQDIPSDNSSLRAMFDNIFLDAESLLESLNGQPALVDDSSGSVARVLAAQDAVARLTRELQEATIRRLEAELKLTQLQTGKTPTPTGSILEDLYSRSSYASSRKEMNGMETGESSKPGTASPASPVTPVVSSVKITEHTTPLSGGPSIDGQTIEIQAFSSPTTGSSQPVTPGMLSNIPEISDDLTPSAISPISPSTLDMEHLPDNSLISTRAGDEFENIVLSHGDEASPPSKPEADEDAIQGSNVALSKMASTPPPDSRDIIERPESPVADAAGIVISETVTVEAVPFPTTNTDAETLESEVSETNLPQIVVAPVNVPDVHTPCSPDHPDVFSPAVPSSPSTEKSSETPALSSLVGTMRIDVPFVSDVVQALNESVDAANETICTEPSIEPPRENNLHSTLPNNIGKHPLLADLVKVKTRYDDLQRAFRDCHLALKELKKDVATLPRSLEMTAIVQTAVDRLDDFNEDARVELEIRVADEERMYTGYETLLSIPGAISEEVDEAELEQEIKAFVDGSNKSVSRAMQQFSRKLDDLEHDIASIKRTLHELSSAAEVAEATSSTSAKHSNGWSSWTGGLLGSSRPVSPSPTFGSVMTSPRLRHSSFTYSNSNRPTLDASSPSPDPFASLELRIPMPAHVIQTSPTLSPLASRPQRPRTTSASAMYMLGLGGRSSSFGGGVNSTPANSSPMKKPSVAMKMELKESDTDTEAEGTDDEDEDVE